MRKKYRLKVSKKSFDFVFAALVIALTLFGLLMVFDASVIEAYQQFGDKYYFVKAQAMWAGLGMLALLFFSVFPHKNLDKLALPIFIGMIVLLIAVLIPGIGVKVQGARRWIDLGFTVLQPSELAKLGVTIYFASWLSKHQRFLPFAFITALVLGLILLEPDMGTAVIVGLIGFTLYFLSGAPIKNIALTAVIGFGLGITLILLSPYRLNRLKTFMDPSVDPLGASYHVRQVLIALGSGGVYGQGIGRSRQKYQYLPEATTDSIFAVIAEETGFIGAMIVILVLLMLIRRGLKITMEASTGFSKLLAGGITSWFAYQTLINLSAMVALLPLTGVPLPFISYGGSSLVTMLLSSGIMLNISKDS
jgi:cell division protein FtsW